MMHAECTSAPPGPVLAPLGAYETEVGKVWSHALITLDPGGGDVQWTVLEAPQDMTLDASDTLVWVATAFDLALGSPGTARIAGPRQTIRIQGCDRLQQCVETSGSIRAIPTR